MPGVTLVFSFANARDVHSFRRQFMQYTTLGSTGITVSRLCLGCMSYGGGEIPSWSPMTRGWQLDKEQARAHFALAIESGINFFDTADVYSVGLSEAITGYWLKEMASREDIVIA